MDTKKELADFISNNNIIGVTAGVTIALVSKRCYFVTCSRYYYSSYCYFINSNEN